MHADDDRTMTVNVYHHHQEREFVPLWATQIIERLNLILRKEDRIMADAQSVLAKITANNALLSSIKDAETALLDGNDTIAAEIQKLKDALAANQPVDFSALDAAADVQAQVITGIAAAIPANTPAVPTP